MAAPIRVCVEGIEDADARRAATERAREATILELYRIGQIRFGRAAGDLGISRGEFRELANRHRIPTTQTTRRRTGRGTGSLDS
jgi:predicted HTH domain antitoxin